MEQRATRPRRFRSTQVAAEVASHEHVSGSLPAQTRRWRCELGGPRGGVGACAPGGGGRGRKGAAAWARRPAPPCDPPRIKAGAALTDPPLEVALPVQRDEAPVVCGVEALDVRVHERRGVVQRPVGAPGGQRAGPAVEHAAGGRRHGWVWREEHRPAARGGSPGDRCDDASKQQRLPCRREHVAAVPAGTSATGCRGLAERGQWGLPGPRRFTGCETGEHCRSSPRSLCGRRGREYQGCDAYGRARCAVKDDLVARSVDRSFF